MATKTTTRTPRSCPDHTATATPSTADHPRSPVAPRLILLLVVLICPMLVMYSAGMFAPRPKIALVTASQRQYWDLIIKGAHHAADRDKVKLTVVTDLLTFDSDSNVSRRLCFIGTDNDDAGPTGDDPASGGDSMTAAAEHENGR